MDSIPGLGRSPGEEHGNPLQYSCLENPHAQRSLAGYSPWGRKESDMTEQLSAHTHIVTRSFVLLCVCVCVCVCVCDREISTRSFSDVTSHQKKPETLILGMKPLDF